MSVDDFDVASRLAMWLDHPGVKAQDWGATLCKDLEEAIAKLQSSGVTFTVKTTPSFSDVRKQIKIGDNLYLDDAVIRQDSKTK